MSLYDKKLLSHQMAFISYHVYTEFNKIFKLISLQFIVLTSISANM
jgi:hypothetical protein